MAGKRVEVAVREYIDLLRENSINVNAVILFGSYATGNAREDSDIDIAIISPDFGKDRIEETVFLKKLAERVDYDLSPRPYSLKQYRKAKRGDFLHDEIMRKGRTISF